MTREGNTITISRLLVIEKLTGIDKGWVIYHRHPGDREGKFTDPWLENGWLVEQRREGGPYRCCDCNVIIAPKEIRQAKVIIALAESLDGLHYCPS